MRAPLQGRHGTGVPASAGASTMTFHGADPAAVGQPLPFSLGLGHGFLYLGFCRKTARQGHAATPAARPDSASELRGPRRRLRPKPVCGGPAAGPERLSPAPRTSIGVNGARTQRRAARPGTLSGKERRPRSPNRPQP